MDTNSLALCAFGAAAVVFIATVVSALGKAAFFLLVLALLIVYIFDLTNSQK